MRSLRLGSAAVVCLGFLVVAPAMADEWGSQDGNTGAHPDEDPHSYCLGSSVSADLEENIDAAAWNALDPTQVNVNYSSTCQLTGAGETDVVWTQGNIASGALAWTDCDDYESDLRQISATRITSASTWQRSIKGWTTRSIRP